jgi:hypothetical protein
MAGEGRFVVVESVLLYSKKEGWDCYGIQKIYKILYLDWNGKYQMRVIIQEFLCAFLILMITQILQ